MSIEIQVAGGRTATIEEPLRGDFDDNVGGAIEHRLAHVIFSILRYMGTGLGVWLGSVFVSFLEEIEPEMVKYVKPLIDDLLSYPELPASFRAFFEQLRNPTDPAAAALLAGVGGQAGGMVMGNVLSSLLAPLTYALNRALEPARLDPSSAKAFAWRFPHLWSSMRNHLHDQGWSDELITGYDEILRPRLDLGGLMRWHGIVEGNPQGAKGELRARGFNDADIDKVMRLWEIIPSVGDLISMATREAWDEETVRRYGYDADMPGEVVEWAGKQGLGADWVKYYWRAHWELPGPTQARDMLYRTSFSTDDYNRLLKAADYPEAFRGWMLETAYQPFTRVDTRRMFDIGILDETQLIRAYQEIGYDESKAAALRDFTMLEYGEAAREGTKSDILHAYELKRYTRDEALAALLALGYQAWVAEVDLSRVDLRVENKAIAEVVKQTKLLYTTGQIDRVTAYQHLSELNLPATEVEAYLTAWDTVRKGKVSRPTKGDLRSMFIDGIIDEGVFTTELSGHGLSDRYIAWFVLVAKEEMLRQAQNEEEKLRKEADRVRKDELSTELSKVLAGHNVTIAEHKVAIAEIKLSIKAWIAPDEITSAQREITRLRQLLFQVPEDERDAIEAQIKALEELIESLTPEEMRMGEVMILGYKAKIAVLERIRRDLRYEYAKEFVPEG